jgi:hypothetical protein
MDLLSNTSLQPNKWVIAFADNEYLSQIQKYDPVKSLIAVDTEKKWKITVNENEGTDTLQSTQHQKCTPFPWLNVFFDEEYLSHI